MGYEREPTELTYAQALLERYGKDYKPALTVFFRGDAYGSQTLHSWFLMQAGPDWVSFGDGRYAVTVPVEAIAMVRVEK